jgi:antirestriction protein ArdC
MARLSNSDVYDKVFGGLVAAMEDAGRWTFPWDRVALAHRSVEGRPYSGGNVFALAWAMVERGFEAPVWGTYRAWKRAGAQVRKGQRGTPVYFFRTVPRRKGEGEDGDGGVVFLAKLFYVFNIAQVDGAPEAEAVEPLRFEGGAARAREDLTGALAAMGVSLAHGGARAFYSSQRDHVQMPPVDAFETAEGYVATLAHEATHATGRFSRLDRKLGNRFGSPAYAFEELVAEFGAAFVCAAYGLAKPERTDNHAAYLASWFRAVREQGPAVLTRAASLAQRAAALILDAAEGEAEAEPLAA